MKRRVVTLLIASISGSTKEIERSRRASSSRRNGERGIASECRELRLVSARREKEKCSRALYKLNVIIRELYTVGSYSSSPNKLFFPLRVRRSALLRLAEEKIYAGARTLNAAKFATRAFQFVPPRSMEFDLFNEQIDSA